MVSDTMDVTSVELSKERFILHGRGYEIGCNCQVKYHLDPSHSVPGVVACRGDGNVMCYPKPSQITHERPGICERLVDSIVRRSRALAGRGAE